MSSTPVAQLEPKHFNPWKSKAHTKSPPSLPSPLPALFRQTVQMADGSTFTTHTTAPSPSIIRLTRDVTNNPVWSPGVKTKGVEEDEDEGVVGRFKKRFEGMDLMGGKTVAEWASQMEQGEVDTKELGWLTEGGREEKAPKIEIKKPEQKRRRK